MTINRMMDRHKADHFHVAYAHSAADADHAVVAEAIAALQIDIEVSLCGV